MYPKNLPSIIVKKSKIEGEGVFAARDFKKGECILDIDDSKIVDEKGLSEKEQNWCDYFDGKVVLWPTPERYINHSCEPNVYIKTVDDTRKVFSMKFIKKGEELTFDYSINGYGNSIWDCHCEKKRCRKKFVLDFFKLPKALQRKYLPYLDEWFKARYRVRLRAKSPH